MNRREFVKALAGVPLLGLLAKLPRAEETTDERNERLWGITADARGGYVLPREASEDIAARLPNPERDSAEHIVFGYGLDDEVARRFSVAMAQEIDWETMNS